MIVDVQMSTVEAAESIRDQNLRYGMIFVNFSQLVDSRASPAASEASATPAETAERNLGIQRKLKSIFPRGYDMNKYFLVVYGVMDELDDDLLQTFEQCKVRDVLEEPYTLSSIKVRMIFCFNFSKLDNDSVRN